MVFSALILRCRRRVESRNEQHETHQQNMHYVASEFRAHRTDVYYIIILRYEVFEYLPVSSDINIE